MEKMDKAKVNLIKDQAAKMGTSFYKYVQPFIVNINDRIGRGSYGEVYKGADIRTGQLVAVKTISTSNIKKEPEKFMQSLKNEIDIMKAIKNKNIVELYDVKKSSNNIYLFQELCDKGSLEEVLEKRKKLPESEVLLIVKQLVSGYRYLHQNSVIHRDLKPANILIKDEVYKIADFGFAKYYQQGGQLDSIHKSLVGSPMYMCPQILNGSKYSTKSDVWSMGVIFFQMLFGKTPHKAISLQELIEKVNKKSIRFPQKLHNQQLQQLLEMMLKYYPDERISWKDIFLLPIFKEEKKVCDLKQSMSIAQRNTFNKLDMSTKLNELYFEKQKVIEQIEMTGIQDVPSILQARIEERPSSQQQDVYKSIALRHEQMESKKTAIRKIKNWFLFKRNKAVFLNHLSLKIHSCFAAGHLGIELCKAEIFILVLSKWQCMITYKSYIRLKEGKINSKAFTEEQYKLFVGSSMRDRIMEKFKNDFTVMKMFFEDLVVKVSTYLDKFEGELPEKLKLIKKICNHNLYPKDQFLKIYQQNIDELAEACAKAVREKPGCRQLLQLGYLVSEALKLKKDELETNDFSMIYDQQEKLSDENLMQRVREMARIN